jgi:integrase
MVRYKETKSDVSIFTPENIACLLKKADATLQPFLALGAFAGLRTAELQRLDWNEIDTRSGLHHCRSKQGQNPATAVGSHFG